MDMTGKIIKQTHMIYGSFWFHYPAYVHDDYHITIIITDPFHETARKLRTS